METHPWYLNPKHLIPPAEKQILTVIGTCQVCGDPDGIDTVDSKVVCLKCLAPTLRASMFGGELH